MLLFHGRLPRLLFKPHVCINSDVICGLNLRSSTAVETGQFGWVAPFQHHFKCVKDHFWFVFVFETLCLYFVFCHVFGFSFWEKWNTLTRSIHFFGSDDEWTQRLVLREQSLGMARKDAWFFLLIDRCKGSLGVFMIGEHGMSFSG